MSANPGWALGYVPSAAEWNGLWSQKCDATDSRLTGALQAANNLSDLTNAAAARTALGLSAYALLASPALTGTPTAPTATAGTATTQIANCAFVSAAVAAATAGVSSLNGRTGAITLTSSDVTSALSFTPYNSSNPAGYITASGAPVQTVAGRTGAVTLAVGDVTGAAPKASPTFTGTVILPAGSTSAQPVKFQAGSLLSIPVAHSVEWDGSALYVTNSSGTRGAVATQSWVQGLGYVTSSGASAAAPVQSVAGRSGAVTLATTDISGFTSAASAAAPVQSVAGRTGAITLAVADVSGAAAASAIPAAASTAPVMVSTTAAVGTGTTFARADHSHPSDTPAVSTIAALRLVTTTTLPASRCAALGYSSIGDGGEGWFSYNSGDTTSADNGGTIIVDASNRRWYRMVAPGLANAMWFGATGNGSTDDTASINLAKVWAATNGVDVIMPAGSYKISSTLTFGNGSSTAVSTWGQVKLRGIGKPPANAAILAGYDTEIANAKCAKLLWYGSAGGTMIQIAGPLQGWGLENLWMDGRNVAAIGVDVVSGQYGDSANLTIKDCTAAAIYSTTVSALPSGVLNADSLHNSWRNTVIGVSWTNGAKAIVLTGVVATGDTDYNVFTDTTIALPTTLSTGQSAYGVYLQAADSNMFINTHFLNGSASQTYAVVYDYTLNADWPCACSFYGVDWGGLTGPVQVVGTPTGNGGPNPIYGLIEANQGTYPTNIPNLITPGGIVNKTRLVGQTASIAKTTLLTAHNANMYRVSYYLNCTGGTATGGTISTTIYWLDGSGSPQVTSGTVPANGPGNNVNGEIVVWVPAGGTISYATTVSSVPSGTTQYAVYYTIERLA